MEFVSFEDTTALYETTFFPEAYGKFCHMLSYTRPYVLKGKVEEWVRSEYPQFTAHFVEQPQNSSEIGQFESFWKDQGADHVVIRRLHSCSGAKVELAQLRRAANQAREVRRPCLYPWERIVVNARGDLAFCPSDWVHGSYVTDYRQTTILDTWRGEFYRRLREAHLSSEYAKHAFCGQCPDWAATRWPHQGRSYADMVQEFIDGA